MLHGVMVLIPNSRWPELQVALIPSIPTFSPSQRYSHGCCRKVVWKDSISYSALGIRGFSPSVPLLASRSATYQELCFAHLTVSSRGISSSLFISTFLLRNARSLDWSARNVRCAPDQWPNRFRLQPPAFEPTT